MNEKVRAGMLISLIIIWLAWWALAWLPPKWIKVNTRLFGAMTIAPFVFYTVEYIPDWLKKHEERHVLQQRILSPPLMLLLYVLNYLINLLWAPFAMVAGLADRDDKLLLWRHADPLAQAHAIAYVYILFELDAIYHGGWYWKENPWKKGGETE